jgi:hypothetical protein
MGIIRTGYRIFVRDTFAKRPLGRPRKRSEDNIRVDIRELGGEFWKCIKLA